MKTENVKLRKNNYLALIMFWVILLFGVLGGIANQNWAENIYVFLSFIFMVGFVISALARIPQYHLKEFVSTYFIHVLFCVGMGWWWLCLYWLLITCSAGAGINYYMKAIKEAVNGENKK